jgi:hypothetical protein
MATVYLQFKPHDAVPPSSNYATLDSPVGTNFPVPCLDFDASTDESAFFFFTATNYGSGNLTLEIFWYADTASSGNVVWEASIAAITPDTDTQDIETKSFASVNYVQDTHLGTTGQRLHKATITISNLDSIASGDSVVLKLSRDANGTNATDDMAGDACVTGLRLSYSDT